MSYSVIPGGDLEQGDIIRHVSVIRKVAGTSGESSEFYRTPVFVLSDSCEIAKPSDQGVRSDTVLVVCVFKLLIALPQDRHGQVRANKIYNAFYLPADEVLPEECFIDWRTVQPVDKEALRFARAGESYLCSLRGAKLHEVSQRFEDFLFRNLPPKDESAPNGAANQPSS